MVFYRTAGHSEPQPGKQAALEDTPQENTNVALGGKNHFIMPVMTKLKLEASLHPFPAEGLRSMLACRIVVARKTWHPSPGCSGYGGARLRWHAPYSSLLSSGHCPASSETWCSTPHTLDKKTEIRDREEDRVHSSTQRFKTMALKRTRIMSQTLF